MVSRAAGDGVNGGVDEAQVLADFLVGQDDHARPQRGEALVPVAARNARSLYSSATAVAESALTATSGTPRVAPARATPSW